MLEKDNEKLQKLSEEFLIGKDCEPEKTIEKLNLLKNFSKNEAVEVLNFFAGKETHPDILLHIIKMLGKFRDKSSANILIELLTDYKKPEEQQKYLKVRCATATVLGDLKDDRAVVPLMYIMNDKNEYYKVRLVAAEALGKIGNTYAVNPLINIVMDEEEKSVYVQESAVKALGMIGDERAIDPLISIIETKQGIIDKFTFLKEKIVEVIGAFGFNQDKKLNALKKALFDESPHVRVRALEALCEIEDESVLSLIEPMLYDKNEEVARNAVSAIYNVAGVKYLPELMEKYDLPAYCIEEINEILEEEEDEDE